MNHKIAFHSFVTDINAQDMWDSWPVAFHGTRKELIRQITDSRMLLLPGDTNVLGKVVHSPQGHYGDNPARRKLVSLPPTKDGLPARIEEFDRSDASHKQENGAQPFDPSVSSSSVCEQSVS